MKRNLLKGTIISVVLISSCIVTYATESGRTLFEKYCVKCHGDDGSVSKYGREITPNPARDLRTTRLFISPRELPTIIKYGVYGREMKAWKDILTDDDIKDVIKYVRSLSYTPNPQNGSKIFKSKCTLCHDPEGPAKKLFKAPDLDMTSLSDLEIARTVRFGRHGTMMLPKETMLTNPEIADVVSYILSIKK